MIKCDKSSVIKSAGFVAFSLAVLVTPAGAQTGADDLLASSRAVSAQLVQQLGVQLKQELARGGPEGAIGVCSEAAPAIAGQLSRQTGARVARVSLKTRNPLLGTPDAWEQAVLADFDRRAGAGEAPESLEFSETVTEPQGRYFRYMKAIPVQPLCLACHGTEAMIAPAVGQRLQHEYPHDRARGYTVGQVRGAVTIKRPLD
jgi:hypothetical protein